MVEGMILVCLSVIVVTGVGLVVTGIFGHRGSNEPEKSRAYDAELRFYMNDP